MTSQQCGAIVYLTPDSRPPSVWKRFLELEQNEKKAHLKKMVHFEEAAKSEEEKPRWSLTLDICIRKRKQENRITPYLQSL